jgi:hypothetical protein
MRQQFSFKCSLWEFQQGFPVSFNDFLGARIPGSLLNSALLRFKVGEGKEEEKGFNEINGNLSFAIQPVGDIVGPVINHY